MGAGTTTRSFEARRAAPPGVICLRWEGARAALASARGLTPSGAAFIAIEWSIHPDGSAEACLVDGVECVRIACLGSGSVVFRHDPAFGLLHLEARGVVAATLREHAPSNGGSPYSLLYARTSVLAELGLPGGRYEATGVRSH